MNKTPPFDPPYITMTTTSDGERYVETLIDGTERVVAAPPILARPVAAASRPATSARQAGPSAAIGGPVERLLLEVPFAEKDNVKRLGAKWDAAQRKWYVPQSVDVNLFSRWWPKALQQKMR